MPRLNPPDCLLITILRDPLQATGLSPAQWDLLLRQARKSFLLAHLGEQLKQANLTACTPALVQRHMNSDRVAVAAQNRAVHWEVHCLKRTLARIGVPLVLLKGAAYVVAGQSMAHGRMFSDMDILVPQDKLADVERVLIMDGWLPTHQNSYDQRYYRNWMHELPPMHHAQRGTSLDVHHNIIPLTSRYHLDSTLLLARARNVNGDEWVKVLSPEDRILHSAAHLFLEGEFDRGLRDLVDLALMLREFSDKSGFWDDLLVRARELGLSAPLYYALALCQQILGVAVEKEVLATSAVDAGPIYIRQALETLFLYALMPAHHSCDTPLTGACRWLLYIRAHYIKMPMHLLLPHLLRKAWVKRFGGSEK